MSAIEKPIIFIGTGRSGSTYISGSILSHRKLAYPSNYQNQFPKYLNVNYIRYLFDNKFWRIYTRSGKDNFLTKLIYLPSESYAVWRYLMKGEVDFSRDFAIDKVASPELKQRVRDYFEKIAEKSGKERFAFKITGPGKVAFLLSIFPDARFVWVKRDLIPTLRSFLQVNFWKSRGINRLWFTGAYSEEELLYSETIKHSPELITAFQLKKLELVTLEELEKYNPPHLIITYEDFLEQPEKYIKNILTLAELNDDPACLNYINKNPVRKKATNDHWVNPDTKGILYKILKGELT